MKQLFFVMVLFTGGLLVSCQSDKNKPAEKIETTPLSATVSTDTAQLENQATRPPVVEDREAKATAELCDCMNSNLAGVNPRVREIIIAAGRSEDPMQTLTAELRKAAGDEDLERFIWELEQFEKDGQLQKCGEDIKRKYKLNEQDKVQQQRFMQAAADNKNCELVYSLMKIGIMQDNAAASRRQ